MSSYSLSSSTSSSPRPLDQSQEQQQQQQPPTQHHQQRSSSLHQSAASYFSYPVTHVVSGLYRRFTDPQSPKNSNNNNSNKDSTMRRPWHSTTTTTDASSATSTLFTPIRTASPFQPPPLTPLTLTDPDSHHPHNNQDYLLTRSLAEEIRLLVPARLQLCDTWRLAYSLERDGASLSTLYENCRAISHRSPRAGYVLIIRDASPSPSTTSSTPTTSTNNNTSTHSSGAVFGAYMTDPPHPDSHYFGTGECFLWRASVLQPPSTAQLLQSMATINSNNTPHNDPNQQDAAWGALERAGLPLPPSADTTHAGRSTTLRSRSPLPRPSENLSVPGGRASSSPQNPGPQSRSGTATPEQIRFKAFPYSGVNDYMMFCETGFLSLGGGDGHYGLWVDSSLEKGVSAASQTFGNEPLSDEGVKFDILGVEVWYVGS